MITQPEAAGQPSDLDLAEDDDVIVLPWWHNWINLVAMAIGIAVLFGALGWVVGNNAATPDPNAADIGFLQDMRWHHDQAIEISRTYLSLAETDKDLRTIAFEIVVGQSQESGLMAQLLRDFGRPETNETDTAMTWMGEPVPIDQMPGLASDAQLTSLQQSRGAAADALFVKLMVAHHQGGIHMAEAAISKAHDQRVIDLATQMKTGQQEEIDEMQGLLPTG